MTAGIPEMSERWQGQMRRDSRGMYKKGIPKKEALTRYKYRYKMAEGQSSLWKGGINYPVTEVKIVEQKWI